MKFLFDSDTWQEIYGSIRKNKVRTGITIIGVLWGIFLLVVLLGAARGLENSFNKAFVFLFGQNLQIFLLKDFKKEEDLI